ncbi:CrcB domain protein [Rhizoctonia solani]|uniref:CrcB domain protein n=1 Tax=Rhizoctonia solani TaxID=456999 RepID=A0A8H7HBV9_9AGAM
MNSTRAELSEKRPSQSSTSESHSVSFQNYPVSLVPPGEPRLQHSSQQSIANLESQEPGATSPPPTAATTAPSRSYHPLSWPVLTLLALPSVLGVLARLGIHSLTTYDGDSVFALAWVQGMGCFVMGLALGKRQTISDFYPPLYTAITTGFCGSLTTFSSWQLDVFQAWSNAGGFHRGWLRDVIDGLTKSAVTALVSLGGLSFGLHISTHIPFKPPRFRPNSAHGKIMGILSLLSYLATIPLYFKLSPKFRIDATSALLFSFPGTLTRHILGTYFNALRANLPIGTLGANSLGTGLLAAFHVIQRTPVTPTACAILQGLIDGYCGCLTTISTFAVEIRGLKGWHAWRYFALSYIIGQLLMVAIVGGSWWSGRVKEHGMCSGPI